MDLPFFTFTSSEALGLLLGVQASATVKVPFHAVLYLVTITKEDSSKREKQCVQVFFLFFFFHDGGNVYTGTE